MTPNFFYYANSFRLTRVIGGSIPGWWAGPIHHSWRKNSVQNRLRSVPNWLLALCRLYSDIVRWRLAPRVEYRARSARIWGFGGVAPKKERRSHLLVTCRRRVLLYGVEGTPGGFDTAAAFVSPVADYVNRRTGALWTPCVREAPKGFTRPQR